ncbi:hypothetical protein BDP27DRAFT_724748 [Rhodocollybia butyracea]|uniref:Uncharacterized protein n=1 Tax=Rhodocollybia butyracea TaxID=206335 RepID=A0A9P5TWA6_9AGAR|nr:hypothetical protein BDP27DRAFT_724748 [Rhodocollybia butyracea]
MFFLHVVRRRMRRRMSAVRTQPEERLMHLERMRGQPAPPLRDAAAIQSLPPSKNIRVLNWLARTRSAARRPPSVSQHSLNTMSERSDERNRGVTVAPPPGLEAPIIPPDDTSNHSHQVQHNPTLHTRSSSSGSAAPHPSNSKSDSRHSFVNL